MTPKAIFDYAMSLPGAEMSSLHGGQCVRVRGKPILNECREPEALSLSLDLETIELLMAADPETYFQTPHFKGWPAVLVRPAKANRKQLCEQIDKACARRASRAQIAARMAATR